jgi:23S rRNA (cytosine1962-C5)-methyltransferase
MTTPKNWQDYEILDSGEGMKLERWGKYTLARPDPQALWPKQNPKLWKDIDAEFIRTETGAGKWKRRAGVPEQWTVSYGDLTFHIKPTTFKHTGLFPEQAANWDFISQKIKSAHRPIKLLNLFAYTGGATLAAAKAGAHITHVDAAEGMIDWAKENAKASGLELAPIRYLVDDALKFVEREHRRGETYDAIIMDPPSYGRGAKGEVWKLEDHILELLNATEKILSAEPLFVLVNAYTTGFSRIALMNMMESVFVQKHEGKLSSDELALTPHEGGLPLPAGIFTRWEK